MMSITLTELIQFAYEAGEVANKFAADPDKVRIKIYGEHGDPMRAELSGVLIGMAISMDLPSRTNIKPSSPFPTAADR